MRAVESEGATVEQAVERALILLDLSRDQVEVEVLQEPNGSTAVVRVAPRGTKPRESVVTGSNRPSPSVSRETVERPRATPDEVEQARTFLAELLGHMELSCRVEAAGMEAEGERARVSVAGDDSALVIGRQGQTLDAIELILNRVMERRFPESGPITVDAEDYRRRRAQKLGDIAHREAERVRRTGQAVELEPMSPRDRRSVHIALRDESGVETHSEGEGQYRHIVIEPARRGAPAPRPRFR
jgi:spoIIIJ-associated protein